MVVGGHLAWWPFGMMAGCRGSLPFSRSGAGECLSVLIAVVGWLLRVVTS